MTIQHTHTEELDELYGVLVGENTYFNQDENTFGICLWNSHDLQDSLQEAQKLLKKAKECGYDEAKIVKLSFKIEAVEV